MTSLTRSFPVPVPQPGFSIANMPFHLGGSIPIRENGGGSGVESEVREIHGSEDQDIKEPEGDTLEEPELDTPPQ